MALLVLARAVYGNGYLDGDEGYDARDDVAAAEHEYDKAYEKEPEVCAEGGFAVAAAGLLGSRLIDAALSHYLRSAVSVEYYSVDRQPR